MDTVDTNERLRRAAALLVEGGISQKVIAAHMGMKTSTFNKWLHDRDDAGKARVDAMDGFRLYVAEQAALFTRLQQELSALAPGKGLPAAPSMPASKFPVKKRRRHA